MKKISFGFRKNHYFLVLFFLSMLNMLFMHYQILYTVGIEFYFGKTSYIDNFLAVFLDVTIILMLFLLLSWGRGKISLLATFVVTLLLSFCNVLYSRFFGQYLTLSAMGQVGNLNDNVVMQSVLSEFRIHDVYYLLIPIIFFLVYLKSKRKVIVKDGLSVIGKIWVVVLLLLLASHSFYLVKGSFGRAIQSIFPSYAFNMAYPNWVTFHKGLTRTLIVDNLVNNGIKKDLSQEQINEIEKEYHNHRERRTGHTLDQNIKNVIFIIVESYLAVTSDLKVDGKEITPNMNALKRESNVYYNGHVQSHAKIGKSSDGQLIYMTGLLPLRSEITVSRALKDSLVGLPRMLLEHGIVKHTRIMVPTAPSFWEQKAMNQAYGIEKMYSKYDYMGGKNQDDLADELVFKFARQLDDEMPPSSFSLVLTLSMHEPFDECVEHGFHLEDPNLPTRYRNYLTTCHYFDEQIGKYIDHLKADGLYDNSLIVIAADHDAHPKFLDMEGKVERDLPLYIINGGIDSSQAWTGSCNQLDVYTTLLDILGVESEWRGLGHTLLNRNYTYSVTDKTWELSEWIINGDYFGRK